MSRRRSRPTGPPGGRARSARRWQRASSTEPRRRAGRRPSGERGSRASTRRRAGSPDISPGRPGGRGSRKARGSGLDRRIPSSSARPSLEVASHGIYTPLLPFERVKALAAIVALPTAAAVIWLLLRTPLAARLGAAPRADRWHRNTTPMLGGIGIFAGIVAGFWVAVASGAAPASQELVAIVGGCTILFVAGLLDDLYSLGPIPKLAAQLAAAGLVIGNGLTISGLISNNVLAGIVALVWLVGLTNAFNLLDNMDGLAASLAAIAALFFAIDALTVHTNDAVLALSLALAGACIGFLPFNLRPKRSAVVFMGDSGSQVLGFALAALGLTASWKVAGTTVATLLLPVLVLAVPILDTTLVTVVRLLDGRPVYQGGRDHTSHRLVYHGLSEKRAVVLLALISAGLGATSLGYTVLPNTRLTAVGVLLTFALLVQFGSFLADVDRGPVAAPHGSRPVRAWLVHRRRLVEVLVDAALITAAFVGAYVIRVNESGTPWDPHVFNVALPVILAARYVAFIVFGLYRGVWRYAGARDALSVIVAVLLSEAAAVGFLAATQKWSDFPRAVFVLDAIFCIALVGASRFGERALFRMLVLFRGRGERHRSLVVGAGRAGRSLLRELNETAGEQVVGFVDDDPRLWGRRLQGVRVCGGSRGLGRVLAQTRPAAGLRESPAAA